MRLATIIEDGLPKVAVVRDGGVLPLDLPYARFGSVRTIAASGPDAVGHIHDWAEQQPREDDRSLADVRFGPPVPDPTAVYTIGLNYAPPGSVDDARPPRPLVYAKLPSSVTGHGSTLTWDRALTANVDPEAELGVVIGAPAVAVTPEEAMGHVFGYTCINDVSSRDPWLDGDQWLLGKSFAGFCPVGPWVVTRDEMPTEAVRLGCTINGEAIQDGSTAQMRFPIAEVISYLSRHVALRPGDLIATGTPARLARPMGPDRHLRAGDIVTVWIEHVGELTTTIA